MLAGSDKLFFDTGTRTTLPFRVFIGARGCGKTYSTLRNLIIDKETGKLKLPDDPYSGKFVYVRRTGREIEISTSETANPFKKINKDFGIFVYPEYSTKTGIATFYVDNGIDNPCPVGYGVALSTFHGLRGVDFSDVDTIVFDEFMRPITSKKIRGEGEAFLHMYETINRNREFEGEPPVTAILMGNAISLNSEILLALGATTTFSSMLLKHQYRASLKEKSLYLEIILKDDFKNVKAETALYKLSKNTDFSKEALDNMFVGEDFTFVRANTKINEYRPLYNYTENYTIYKHKSRIEFFISHKTNMKAPVKLSYSMTDRLEAMFGYSYEYSILNRCIFFDDYATKLVFDAILLGA